MDIDGLRAHMRRHREILRSKFESDNERNKAGPRPALLY